MKYIVVEAYNVTDFQAKVNIKVSEGFEPVGGVCVTPTKDISTFLYAQAMVKK